MDTDKNPIILKLDQPFSTSDSAIVVSGLLHAGEYRFQLVVTDQAGNCSQPAIVSVIVKPPVTFLAKLRSWIASFVRLLTMLFNKG